MIQITDKKLCSGCHACATICPKTCISMNSDHEGFWYPEMNVDACIQCGLCEKVCPILHKEAKEVEDTKAYACISNDEASRRKSSSGGVFTLLANYVLDNNGVVFGASFADDFSVVHKAITNKEDLVQLRGSKYQQSKIGNCYALVKQYLLENRLVYFSGTPCQIDGLKAFLQKDYENLICQDIICHGVPSPKAFQLYLKEVNAMYQEEPIAISYREKVLGWNDYCMRIDYPSRSYVYNHRDDVYMKAFLKDYTLRPSCYDCHSKGIKRYSDLTLADFWGVQDVLPSMFDKKGTSLVIVHSEKGKDLLDKIQDQMMQEEIDVKLALQKNPSMIVSSLAPKDREQFMSTLDNESFSKHVNRYIKNDIFKEMKRLLRRIVKRIKK